MKDSTGRGSTGAVVARMVTALAAVVALLGLSIVVVSPATAAAGDTWTARAAAQNNAWLSVAYGGGRFVAVSGNGTNRVMTSPDGVTWTARAAAEPNQWMSVTYGGGRFVAVSSTGVNRVMTSPDGVTWTARAAAQANQWRSVTYGDGRFVAVSDSGPDRVMTSVDGVTWTARAAAEPNYWWSVAYGGGGFVAVSANGPDRVMTSPDGVTWTARAAAQNNVWLSLTYGDGGFVAVSANGPDRVMTSPDGVTWTARAAAQNNDWVSVSYGDGRFVAVSDTGVSRVMTSPDGVTWTARAAAEPNEWRSVAYSSGLFVAVSTSGTSRVMTSGTFSPAPEAPVAVSYTPLKRDRTRVRWEGSAGAVGYRVLVNGAVKCITGDSKFKCRFEKAYGPRADVSVIALGAAADSAAASAEYRRSEKRIVFTTVHFSYNSAKLAKDSRRAVRKDTKALARQGFKTVKVYGYTARERFPKKLSKKRAVAVKTVMVKKLQKMGVTMRVKTVAKGNKDPLGNNNTKKGRAKNRRATITIR